MRTLIRTAVVWVAMLLAACTGGGQAPTPAPSSPTPTAASASPTPKPSPTPSPSPTPTLDADQAAARDVVLKYFELENQFRMDPSRKDLTPLTNITTGDAQKFAVESIDHYRMQGSIQTAAALIEVLSVGSVTEDSSKVAVVQVFGCVDATQVDVVNEQTGESVLPKERRPISTVTVDVVREKNAWLVNQVAATPVEACP